MQWIKFKWYVTKVKRGPFTQNYLLLVRMQNERHTSFEFAETTLKALFRGPSTEYAFLWGHKLNVSSTQYLINISPKHHAESGAYDSGAHKKNTSVRKEGSVAARISWGEMINLERKTSWSSSKRTGIWLQWTCEHVGIFGNCLYFAVSGKFLCWSTLRAAKNFMSAVNYRK